MTWLDLAVVMAVTTAIIVLPGLGLTAVLGLRGLWAWGLAGPFGVTVIVLASLVAPLVGVGWSLIPVAVVFAVIAAGLVVARVLTGGLRAPAHERPQGSRGSVPVAALAVAALLIGWQLIQVIQSPGNISQTFDNIFHLNGIRFALDTTNASPLHLGSMTSDTGGVWFYPSAWHAIGSLVVQVTGADIAVVTNGLAFVTSCLLWPAGAVLLARTAFGAGSAVVASAGVFAAALPSMPLLVLSYGVLYPYQLGLSLTPAALAALLAALRLASSAGARISWVWIVAVAGTLPALAIAHPGAFMAWLVLASVAVLVTFVGYLRSRPGRRGVVLASSGFVVFVGLALVAWRVLKPPADARGWPTNLTMAQALGDALMLSYWWAAIPILVVLALAVGVVVAARRHRPVDVWALAGFAAASLLYIASISVPWQVLRDLLTASWYNNAPRLAAIVPIVIVPLAAAGAAAVWAWLQPRIERALDDRDRSRGLSSAVVGAVLLAAMAVGTQMGAVAQAVGEGAYTYALTPDSALVSEDEMTLLRRLDEEVPEGAVIAGSPWTGAGLAYALADREVLMPHTLMDVDDDTVLINDELRAADDDPAVCQAIEEKGVAFVLDFGDREVHGDRHRYPGLERLARSDAVELVDSEGDAALYRITACAGGA